MNRRGRWVLAAVVVAMSSVAGTASAQATSTSPGAPACDRACLRSVLDQYLNAVIKHDPSAAPLAVGFRQTENAVNVAPGKGVWKSVTALGNVQRRYLDPVSGQAGYYGTVKEGNETAVVTVRLRVENRSLTEAGDYQRRCRFSQESCVRTPFNPRPTGAQSPRRAGQCGLGSSPL